jgi:hypothetical protein
MPTTLIDGIAFKHSLPESAVADAMKMIEKSRSATKATATALVNSIKSGDESTQVKARQWLMTSPHALLTSAIAANKKLRTAKRQTLEKCLAVPGVLDLNEPIAEVVPVRPKAKKSGGFRMLHDHGLLHRTAQNSVRRIVGTYFVPRSFQYTHNGVQAAIARTKKAIMAGHIYIARLDIKDFYPSFSAEALITELPLNEEAVEHAVIGRHMKVVMDQDKRHGRNHPMSFPHTQDDLLLLARLGIPQGSGCSPIIGMFCISRLLWAPMPGVILLNYADDFLLLALSETLLSEAVGKLIDAVANVPGGHFDLRLKSTSEINKGFNFLGHHLQLVDANLKTKPTESNLQDLYGTLNPLEEKIGKLTFVPGKIDKAAALTCLASCHAFVEGWKAAFSECDDIERWLSLPSNNLKELLSKVGASPDEMVAAVEPWMLFEPSDYALGH